MHAPDKKCAVCRAESLGQGHGLVMVNMISDEHSAGPLEGFNLADIPMKDAELVGLAMALFKINPRAPGARAQLRRALCRQLRRRRAGRPGEAIGLVVAMTIAGATDADSAPAAAVRIAPYFPHHSPASLAQKIRRLRRGP